MKIFGRADVSYDYILMKHLKANLTFVIRRGEGYFAINMRNLYALETFLGMQAIYESQRFKIPFC